ncbi:ATP-binding protein [Nocardia sp. NPDC020380]|uniref:ATP-binding protein n=1 Tax=Nocardia sp. NPDC020380 TaxID=3364309 RepID=UPI003790E033
MYEGVHVAAQDREDHKYTMRISRLAIDKLGIRLYDRVSAVLAELIANSYDADATEVEVLLPWGVTLAGTVRAADEPAYEIHVSDNGHGMTAEEVNEYYLMVGSDRRVRTGSDLSRDRRRPVMGRKGIGKLAAFGICRTIEVVTAGSNDGDRTAEGWPVAHIVMDLNDMLSDTESDYYPKPGALDGTFSHKRGTTVILRNFFRKRVNSGTELSRQLASRFGIERSDWRVEVRNTIGSESFTLSDLAIDVMEETRIDVGRVPVRFGRNYLPMSGWIAYSKQPYRDEAMAGVRIYARQDRRADKGFRDPVRFHRRVQTALVSGRRDPCGLAGRRRGPGPLRSPGHHVELPARRGPRPVGARADQGDRQAR